MKYNGFFAQISPVRPDGVADTHQDKIHQIPGKVLTALKVYAEGRWKEGDAEHLVTRLACKW